MKILEFIKENKENWLELLEKEPYCLKIKKDEKDRYIFNYSQIFSKEKEEIVKESRGLILKEINGEFEILCLPFYRFFNYGQDAAATINWNKCIGYEKVDGSIIKIWFDKYENEWIISTNAVIDARNSDVTANVFYKNFYELTHAALALEKDFIGFENLDKDVTYLFEVCSPFNKVVIDYPLSIYHIGSRNNITQKEFIVDIGVRKPKEYKFNSLADCIAASSALPFNDEGYIICDEQFNRIKVKSAAYVIAHRLKGANTVPTELELLELVLIGEVDEFLSYFKEYTSAIEDIQKRIELAGEKVEEILPYLVDESRKEIALRLENSYLRDYIMKIIFGTNKDLTFLEYLQNISIKKALVILKHMDF